MHRDPEDVQYICTDRDKYSYKLNICGNYEKQDTNDDLCAFHQGMVCQYLINGNRFLNTLAYNPLATVPTTKPEWSLLNPSNASAGVQLSFDNGDYCTSVSRRRQVPLRFAYMCMPDRGEEG